VFRNQRLITIGLAPCWDITCRASRWRWGRHDAIEHQTARPAGKALNVCRALAELKIPSLACGLWGRDDLPAVAETLRGLRPWLQCRFTGVPGHTRYNVTLIDSARRREMHLRAPNTLLDGRALRRLAITLERLIVPGSICIFAGALPADEHFDSLMALIRVCRQKRARIVVDTSGPALRKIVETEPLWLIKPNVEEFRELIGHDVPDRPDSLYRAAQALLPGVANVLISRAGHGAMLVNACGCRLTAVTIQKPVQSTVACGDYLLAGFLACWLKTRRFTTAIDAAVRIAAFRAWGLTDQPDWPALAKTLPLRHARLS
jgi:1-phosphofructokinase